MNLNWIRLYLYGELVKVRGVKIIVEKSDKIKHSDQNGQLPVGVKSMVPRDFFVYLYKNHVCVEFSSSRSTWSKGLNF